MVRVTHPFHPLFGREFAFLTYRKNWGEDRVYIHNDAGRLMSLPARWTDFLPADSFEALSAGRAHFRPADLVALAELIGGLRSNPEKPRPEETSQERKETYAAYVK